MSAKSKRVRPATSEACDIRVKHEFLNNTHNTWLASTRYRSYSHDPSGSSEQSLNETPSSFDIDDAAFFECLVNDIGSPEDQPRYLLSSTPPHRKSADPKETKRVTFSNTKSKSMPYLASDGDSQNHHEKKKTSKNLFTSMLKKPHHHSTVKTDPLTTAGSERHLKKK